MSLFVEVKKMSKKKIVMLISFFFCISAVISQEKILDLFNTIIENNSEIKQAEKEYNNAILSKNGANGYFSPSISISSTANVSAGYAFDKSPENFSSIITYNQPVLNGTSIGISGNYSYSITEIEKERFITQNSQLTFKLTQSLFPFWIQGTLKDPYLFSLKKQVEYYYNKMLYTKQSVLQDFIQNYIYAQIEYNQIQILKNTMDVTTKQISALIELKNTGGSNFSKISELENLKWSYEQDLLSSKIKLKSYLQNIMTLTEKEFSEDSFYELFSSDLEIEKLLAYIRCITNCNYNTYEEYLLDKIEIEQITLQNIIQESAPIAEVSIQPLWNSALEEVTDWKKSWKVSNKPTSWNVSITVNLSPLLNMNFNKTINKKKLELESAQNIYNSYLKQKHIIKKQYEDYITEYENHYNIISTLIKNTESQLHDLKFELERGQITQLDYEKMDVQVKNMILTSKCLELYIFLYKFLNSFP